MQNGFSDKTPAIREVSIKCLVPLCEKLNKTTIKESVSKILFKSLNDPEAALRTNSVICFGKIASIRFAFALLVTQPQIVQYLKLAPFVSHVKMKITKILKHKQKALSTPPL